MTDEYAHLANVALSQFRHREERSGHVHAPTTLDRADYCDADLQQIGGTGRGMPNRVAVAAFTDDVAYLTLYGAKPIDDALLAKMSDGAFARALD